MSQTEDEQVRRIADDIARSTHRYNNYGNVAVALQSSRNGWGLVSLLRFEPYTCTDLKIITELLMMSLKYH